MMLRAGGVVAQQGFLEKFFPDTLSKPSATPGDLYCTYNDQKIQWFTSSLFLAGAATEVSGTTGEPCICSTHDKYWSQHTTDAPAVLLQHGSTALWAGSSRCLQQASAQMQHDAA